MNNIQAATKIQSLTRGYLARKAIRQQKNATNWVNSQIPPTHTATSLFFKIVKKWIDVPNTLSLPLILNVLIEKGANVNDIETCHTRFTALHDASLKGYLEMGKLLIEHGANVNAKNCWGWTPLYFSTSNGYLDFTKLLIEHGADVNAPDNKGFISLHNSSYGHLEITQFLIEKGANVNAASNDGYTPLHCALQEGHLDIAKLLKIVDHLDQNDSIDTLTSDSENLTSEQVKNYYYEYKEFIDSLMKQRKIGIAALSIVHNPRAVVLHDDFNKEGVVKYSLSLMKTNNRVRFLPSFSKFPLKEGNEWNFDIFGPIISFFTIQDLGKLAQVNKEFCSIFFTSSADEYLSKLISYLISQEDGIQILIDANKRALTSQF